MSLTTITRHADYVGTGVLATYSFTFPVTVATDLVVTTATTAGVETTLIYPTNYTVSLNADGTGSVTLVAGVLTTGYAISIKGAVTLTQPVSIKNQGPYSPSVIEGALDRATMQIQQLQDNIDRCIQVAATDTVELFLPAAATRASKYLGFDAAGNPIAIASAASTASVSAYAATLLDDTTAAIARATLGFTGTGGKVAKADLDTGAKNLNITAKTANYTLLNTDDVIVATATGGAFTLTLPSAASNSGKIYFIKRLDTTLANAVTVARAGSDTILDGAASSTTTALHTIGETIALMSDGVSVWYVLNRRIPQVTVSFTPTGSWVSGTTSYTGYYTRRGNLCEFQIRVLQTGGAPTAVTLTVNLPTGVVIDTAKLLGFAALYNFGVATYNDTGVVIFAGNPVGYSSTTALVAGLNVVSGTNIVTGTASSTAPFAFNDGDFVDLKFTVPVSGWNG